METLEPIAAAFTEELKEHCPFVKEDAAESKSEESVVDDDTPKSTQGEESPREPSEQGNEGHILGQNLASASNGAPGTGGGPYPPPAAVASRDPRCEVIVPSAVFDQERFPVIAAAHHLIPGNASLGRSELYHFLGPAGSGTLAKGKSTSKGAKREPRKRAKVGKRKCDIDSLIGYNVNGAHNGVWLPGHYGIHAYVPARVDKKTGKTVPERLAVTPSGDPKSSVGWGRLKKTLKNGRVVELHDNWRLRYVAAATKAIEAQFHDTHTRYNGEVLETLNAIATALLSHLNGDCKQCGTKSSVPPPYIVKKRLYMISKALRDFVCNTQIRKSPFATSDYWSTKLQEREALHLFHAAYEMAEVIKPRG